LSFDVTLINRVKEILFSMPLWSFITFPVQDSKVYIKITTTERFFLSCDFIASTDPALDTISHFLQVSEDPCRILGDIKLV